MENKKTTKTCDICFTEDLKEEDFFDLKCCKNNSICLQCENLLLEEKCPFCRSSIVLSSSYKKRNRSNSYTEYPFNSEPNEMISFIDTHLESFDDITYYSRIYRRKRIRMLKLRERHENFEKNNIKSKWNNKNKNKKFSLANLIKKGLA